MEKKLDVTNALALEKFGLGLSHAMSLFHYFEGTSVVHPNKVVFAIATF